MVIKSQSSDGRGLLVCCCDGRGYGNNPRTSKEAKHLTLIRYETVVSICDVMPRENPQKSLGPVDSHPRHPGHLSDALADIGLTAEKQHTSCIQQHCVEASADSLHTNCDQSPRLMESPLDRVVGLGGFTLPAHCSTSASQIEPTSCFVQSALQFTAAVRLMATRSTCVSNCARGCESICSDIGIV